MHQRLNDRMICGVHVSIQWKVTFPTAVKGVIPIRCDDPVLQWTTIATDIQLQEDPRLFGGKCATHVPFQVSEADIECLYLATSGRPVCWWIWNMPSLWFQFSVACSLAEWISHHSYLWMGVASSCFLQVSYQASSWYAAESLVSCGSVWCDVQMTGRMQPWMAVCWHLIPSRSQSRCLLGGSHELCNRLY